VTHQANIAAALSAARARDGRAYFVGHIECYCENPDCPAREVEIFFKELDEPLPSRLGCPACRRQLKLHHVQTLDEQEQADEADARRSVNAQLWRRAHPDAFAMPLGAFLDDRLPEPGGESA
jgi:hypothetical protein